MMSGYDVWLSTPPNERFEALWEQYLDAFLTPENIAKYNAIKAEYDSGEIENDESRLARLALEGIIPSWDDYCSPTYGRPDD